jgi:hypothetical protein
LQSNTTGIGNTANGTDALFNNTADANTAVGNGALFSNTTGVSNTAIGAAVLHDNTIGFDNTATGLLALTSNTEGFQNTATGGAALQLNITGNNNTADGAGALNANTNGSNNTATGLDALVSSNGDNNTADGFQALSANTSGSSNTAIGDGALSSDTTGGGNTAVGRLAGTNVTSANNVICIGSGVAGTNVSGTTYMAGIFGVTTQLAATPVVIDSNGQLGTASSSRRFKREVKPMDQTSEAILSLKPVTFQYKADKTGTPQFGLIAEEVAEVNPNLVVRGKDGEIYTVRYDAVNAMLLNEFLKEHRKVEKLEATVADLATQLRQVSAQLQMNNSPAQVVANHQ